MARNHNNSQAVNLVLLLASIGATNKQLLKIKKTFGELQSMLDIPYAELAGYLRPASVKLLKQWQQQSKLPDMYVTFEQTLEACGAQVLSIDCDSYSNLLADIHDPPAVLFARGDLGLLALPHIAMVGSRKLTPQGGRLAHQLAKELAAAGFVITSGLALGIDGAAHSGALSAGGKTCAVMATGIDKIYPVRHRQLAQQIIEQRGLILTEFLPGKPPIAGHFPQRNRVVTGLSMGTLVIEAGVRSGSLISARLANEQGREVFAVPGSVMSPVSEGCHQLIREGATLITKAEHVVEQLDSMLKMYAEQCHIEMPREAIKDDVPSENRAVQSESSLLNIMGFDSQTVDQLCEQTGGNAAEVLAQLAELEIMGIVSESAGSYQRLK